MVKVIDIEGLHDILTEIAPNSVVNDHYYGPISKAMAASGKLLEKQIKQNLKDNGSIGATGQLINAINSSDAILEGNRIVVYVGAGGVPYAEAVEFGSDPHPLPASAMDTGGDLYRWVNIKKIAGTYKDGRRVGGKKRVMGENKRTAWSIAGGIKKRGTKAHPYFYRAVDQQKGAIAELISEACRSVFAKVLKKI